MLNLGHAIMFHHFYDDKKHIYQQGAINKQDLLNILDYYSKKYNILDAREWLEKAISNKLDKKDVCLTFDDGLKCQYDIANTVLEEYGNKDKNLTAFYFVYTSIFTENFSKLEIHRYFRNLIYKNIDDFYNEFFNVLLDDVIIGKDIKNIMNTFNPKEYLQGYDFYTDNDRLFRYLRDNIITDKYYYFMEKIMNKYNFNIEDCIDKIWVSKDEIKDLYQKGNIIGLHTHSHPTNITSLNKKQQYEEYYTNKTILENIINDKIVCMSHPCGYYNNDTLNVLKDLGIKIGFRSNMIKKGNSKYEFLREDHINIFNKLRR